MFTVKFYKINQIFCLDRMIKDCWETVFMLSYKDVYNKGCFFSCSHRSAMNWNKGGPGVKRGFGFGGFSLAGKKEEPPLPQSSHTSFVPPGSSGKNQQLPSFYKIGSKRANFDEENA